MIDSASRQVQIEIHAGDGNLAALRKLFENAYTQYEIDVALENAIAYSQIETAEYLISLGADFSTNNFQGVYYAVHNNELKGLEFAVQKGVDVNVNAGMLVNTSILTSVNNKTTSITKWLLENGADQQKLAQPTLKLIDDFGNDELKT